MTSSHLLTEPKFGRPKRIKIWANGDSQCYEFNINPKNCRSWTAILMDVTNVIRPYFGAIRKLVALDTMTIIDCFKDLDQNGKYVALGINCKFKQAPGGYQTISEKESVLKEKSTKKNLYKREPFLNETKRKNLTIVYIVVNGTINSSPEKVVFNENDMKNWDIIYNYLTKKLDVPEGINNIYTIFGKILRKPNEFQHGYLYVAVPFQQQFVTMDYAECLKGVNNNRSGYTMAIGSSSESTSRRLISKPGDGRSSNTSVKSMNINKDTLVSDPIRDIPADECDSKKIIES